MKLETHIQVADIPEEGLFLNFEEFSHLLPEVDEFVRFGPTSGRLEIHKAGHEIRIKGWVKGLVYLKCDRCLKTVTQEVETSFFYLLQPKEEFGAGLDSDYQLTSDDIDTYWYEDGEIHGEEIFREQILLQLPMRVLCSEECKGLCPGCGADLNVEKCRCKKDHSDSPFAILAKLKAAG